MNELFYIFRCPKCGNFQSKIIKKKPFGKILKNVIFKCIYCNFSTKLKKKKEWGLSIRNWGPYATGQEAAKVCAWLKSKRKEE